MARGSERTISTIIEIGGEQKFGQTINQMGKELSVLSSEMARVTSAFSANDTEAEKLAKKQEVLGKQIEQQKAQLDFYNKAVEKEAERYEKAKVELEKLTNAHERDEKAIRKAQSEYNSALKALQYFETGANRAETSLNNMTREFAENEKALKKWSGDFSDIDGKVGQFGKAMDSAKRELKEFADQIAPVAGQVATLGTAMGKIGGAVLSTGFNTGKAALEAYGKAAATAATAVAGLGAAAVKTGMEFEQEMSNVAATAGITSMTQEYADLEEAALSAANTTKYTAKEAAQGLNYLMLSGIGAEKSIAALPGVLNLAAAGNMELATASDLATDALAALGNTLVTAEGETVTLESLMDQMAKTAQSANTGVAQLGEATLEVAGTANLFGMSLTDMNAELGILANRGYKGSEGGQKLRNVLLRLISPTKDAAAQLEALGVSVATDEGEIRRLDDILQDLNHSLEGLTDDEKAKAIADIFNTRDISAVNALLAGAGEEFANLAEKIEDSEGAAQQMAETMLDNLSGSLEILKSNLSTTGIEIKKLADGALKSLAKSATEAVVGFREALEEGGAQGALAYVEELIPKLGTAIVDGLAEIVPESQKGFDRLLTAGIESLIENIPGAVERVGYPLLEEFRQTVENVTEGVKDDLPGAIGSVGGMIIDSVPVIIDAGFKLFTALAQGLGEALPDLLAKAGEAVKQIGDDIQENKGEMIKAGSELLYGVLEGLDEALPDILIGVGEIAEGIVETFYASIWNAFERSASDGTASKLEKLIVGVLSPPALLAQEFIEGTLRGDQTLNSLQEQRNEMYGEMSDYIIDLLKQGKNAGEAIRQAQQDLFGEDTEKMKFFQFEMYDTINEEIVEKWRQNLANSGQITGPIKQAAADAEQAAKKMKTAGSTMAEYYEQQGKAALKAREDMKKAGDAAEEMSEAVTGAAYDASEAFGEEMDEIGESAEDAVKAAEEAEKERQKTANEIRSGTLSKFKEIQKEEKSAFSQTLKDETSELKAQQKEQTEAVTKAQKEQTAALKNAQKEQQDALEKAHRKILDQIDEEYLERLKLVDEEAYNRIKAAQAEIDAIDAQTAAEEAAREQREEAEKRQKLQQAVWNAQTAEERREAQEALNDFEEETARKKILKEREQQKTSLNQEIEDIRKIAEEEAKLTELQQKVWAAGEDEKEDALKAYNDYAAQLEKERAEDGRAAQYADLILNYQNTRDAAEKEHEIKAQLENQLYNLKKENLDKTQTEELAHLEGLQAAELKMLENVQKQRLADLEEYQEKREKAFDDAQTEEYNSLNKSLGNKLGITENDSAEKTAAQSQSLLDAYLAGRKEAEAELSPILPGREEEKSGDTAALTEITGSISMATEGISGTLSAFQEIAESFSRISAASSSAAVQGYAEGLTSKATEEGQKETNEILSRMLGVLGTAQPVQMDIMIPGGASLARVVINNINDYIRTTGKDPWVKA